MKTRDILLLAVVVFAATYAGNMFGRPAAVNAQTTPAVQKWEYKIVRIPGGAWNSYGVCDVQFTPDDKNFAALGNQGWQYIGSQRYFSVDPMHLDQIAGCSEYVFFMRPSN